jgi:hypothetical protein
MLLHKPLGFSELLAPNIPPTGLNEIFVIYDWTIFKDVIIYTPSCVNSGVSGVGYLGAVKHRNEFT